MNMSVFLNLLGSANNPVLPDPSTMRVALHLVWAIVLGSGTMLVAGKCSRPFRIGLSVLVMAWTLVPGSASPAYWLGLAFQTPSLMSAVICVAWFLNRARPGPQGGVQKAEPPIYSLKVLAAAGIALGWVLLLDALAWLPVSVYAWGFSPAALGVVAVLATLLWVAQGIAGGRGFAWTLFVLTFFVLTRLPTGNVWDALLDPWLWVALQAGWLISAARRLKKSRRLLPATRA
jgi:hypothetical protein